MVVRNTCSYDDANNQIQALPWKGMRVMQSFVVN